jgi:hypothetical protein
MKSRDEVTPQTSPRAMSIRVSRSWRRYDACPPQKPPLHLTPDFVESQHRNDACPTYEKEFSEREELAADIIIDACLALRQQGCRNIEQVIKDRIAWRLEHKD